MTTNNAATIALKNALAHDFHNQVSDLARAAGITVELARMLGWSCESSNENGAVFLAWAHLPVGSVEVMIAIEYKAFDPAAGCLRHDRVVRVDNREVFMPYKAAA